MSLFPTKLHFPFGHPKESDGECWWRVEAKRYSYVINEWGDHGVTAPRLEATWWPVDKKTPKGAWICGRFCLASPGRRFARPTLEEALESFAARKRRQISILNLQLSKAEIELSLFEGLSDEDKSAAPKSCGAI